MDWAEYHNIRTNISDMDAINFSANRDYSENNIFFMTDTIHRSEYDFGEYDFGENPILVCKNSKTFTNCKKVWIASELVILLDRRA